MNCRAEPRLTLVVGFSVRCLIVLGISSASNTKISTSIAQKDEVSQIEYITFSPWLLRDLPLSISWALLLDDLSSLVSFAVPRIFQNEENAVNVSMVNSILYHIISYHIISLRNDSKMATHVSWNCSDPAFCSVYRIPAEKKNLFPYLALGRIQDLR